MSFPCAPAALPENMATTLVASFLGAAIGTASGLLEYGMALALTVVVFFAHVALRRLSAWIERVAPPEEAGPL